MKNYQSIVSRLKPGDRVVVPKSSIRWVQHHAIYLVWNNGHHWFIENKEGVGVRTITAEQFFKGVLEVTHVVRFRPRWNYSREDLVRFALSKRGRKYDLLAYNCESFANEVQHRKVESQQAKTGVTLGLTTLTLLLLIPLSKR
ncbi:MAG: hypothetical protein LPK49_09875 [Bacteroidota bacterium]|nr:hypothetical protein [Bacteroidota bacterium]